MPSVTCRMFFFNSSPPFVPILRKFLAKSLKSYCVGFKCALHCTSSASWCTCHNDCWMHKLLLERSWIHADNMNALNGESDKEWKSPLSLLLFLEFLLLSLSHMWVSQLVIHPLNQNWMSPKTHSPNQPFSTKVVKAKHWLSFFFADK